MHRALAAVTILALAGCATAARRPCPEMTWARWGDQAPAERMAAPEAVLWSAVPAIAAGRPVLTPCGDRLSCGDVASYVIAVGGRVRAISRCGVSWALPEG